MQNATVEHIIIDGGSTDGTVEIIRKHENKLAYWVSEADSGQSHAINKGLERATGTWFNWLNADDQLTENALQTILETAKSDTQVVVGKCQHFNSKNEVVDEGSARIWDSLEATLGNYSMGQPSLFYRTETVKYLGGPKERLHFCLDMDLWFRFLLQHGLKPVQITEKILSRFLVHESGKSSAKAAEVKAEKYGIYHALLDGPELPEVLRKFFAAYPIPDSVKYELPRNLNRNELLANFAWHLMVDSFGKKEMLKCRAYFEVVKSSSRLSKMEQLEWKARIASRNYLKA